MEKKFIQIGSIQVCVYTLSNPSKPNIFLVHGNSLHAGFFEPLAQQLQAHFNIAAIDLAGCGQTQLAQPNPNNLTFAAQKQLIQQSVQALFGSQKVMLFGNSLGGHLLTQLLPHLPQAHGLVLQGTPPIELPPAFESAFLPSPAMVLASKGELTMQEAATFANAMLLNTNGSQPVIDAVMQTNTMFRPSILGSLVQAGLVPEPTVINNAPWPVLIINGAHEKLVNTQYINELKLANLFGEKQHLIDQAAHLPFWEQPQATAQWLVSYQKVL